MRQVDVSKTISHRKMLHYWLFIDITVNNYNLPRSLKGAVPDIVRSEAHAILLSRFMS